MNDRRSQERLYTAVVVAFLIGLVGLGLLGVPALLVAAIGAAVAGLGIAVLQRRLTREDTTVPRRPGSRESVPAKYVPSVLEGSSMKRRRLLHLRRHRDASAPLRFR